MLDPSNTLGFPYTGPLDQQVADERLRAKPRVPDPAYGPGVDPVTVDRNALKDLDDLQLFTDMAETAENTGAYRKTLDARIEGLKTQLTGYRDYKDSRGEPVFNFEKAAKARDAAVSAEKLANTAVHMLQTGKAGFQAMVEASGDTDAYNEVSGFYDDENIQRERYSVRKLMRQSGYTTEMIDSGVAEIEIRKHLGVEKDESTRDAYLRWGLAKQNEIKRKKDLTESVSTAVYSRWMNMDPKADFSEDALGFASPDVSDEERVFVRRHVNQVRERLDQEFKVIKPLMRKLTNTIAAETGQTTKFTDENDEAFASIDEAALALAKDIPQKDFPKALDMMSEIAKSHGWDVDDTMDKLGRRFMRPAENVYRGIFPDYDKKTAGASAKIAKQISTGTREDQYIVEVFDKDGKSVGFDIGLNYRPSELGKDSYNDVFLNEKIKLTPAQAEKAYKAKHTNDGSTGKVLTDFDDQRRAVEWYEDEKMSHVYGEEIRDWRETVSRAKGDNWFTENFVYGVLGSAPEMAAAAFGLPGVAIIAQAQMERNMAEVRRRDPSGNWEASRAPALVAATGYGLLNRLQLQTAIGKLPATNRFIGKLKHLRLPGTFLSRTGKEALQESAQDLTFATTMEFYGALDEDIKDFDLMSEVGDSVKRFPKTMLAVSPLVIGGIAGRGALNYIDARKYREHFNNKEMMEIFGADENAQAFLRSVPVEEGLDYIKDNAARWEQNRKAIESVTPDANISFDENGDYKVTGNGQTLTAHTPEEAAEAAMQIDPTASKAELTEDLADLQSLKQKVEGKKAADESKAPVNATDLKMTPEAVGESTSYEMSLMPGSRPISDFIAGEAKSRKKAGAPPLVDEKKQWVTKFANLRYRVSKGIHGRMIGTKALNQIAKQSGVELAALESSFNELANSLDRATKAAAKLEPKQLREARAVQIQEDGFLALYGDKDAMDRLPKTVQKHIETGRKNIDFVSKQLIASGMLTEEVETAVGDNIGKYVFREFKVFQNGSGWTYKGVKRDHMDKYIAAQKYIAEDKKITLEEADLIIREMLDPEKSNEGNFLMGSSKVGKVDITSFIKKQELAPEILDLLGEVRNPAENLKNTGAKGAKMLTTYAMQAKMAEVLLEMKLASKKVDIKKRFLTKNFIGRELVPVNITDPVTGETEMISVERVSAKYAGFGKLWVEPEILKELETYFELGPKGKNLFETVAGVLATVVTFGKFNQVVLSPQAYGTNFLGGIAFELAAGRVSWNSNDGAKAYKKILMKDINREGKRENPYTFEEQEKVHAMTVAEHGDSSNMRMEQLEGELRRANLLDNSVFAGDLNATIDRAFLEEVVGDKAGKKIKKTFKGLSKGYQATDNAAKASAFIHEVNKWKKALPTIDPKTKKPHTMKDVFDRAARDTRVTTQNYDMVLHLAKIMSQHGFLVGSYISFTMEMIRNTGGNVMLAREEFASGNPVLIANASKRVAGTIALGTTMYGLTSTLSSMMSGFDNEEREKLRASLPPWNKYSVMTYTGRNKDGNLGFFDASFIIPQQYFYNAAAMMLAPGDLGDRSWNTVRALTQPLEDVNILTQLAVDLWNGEKESGKPLYDYSDDSVTKTIARVDHIFDSMFKSGLQKSVERWNKARAGEVGYAGDTPNVNDWWMAILGIRQRHIDTNSAEFIEDNLKSYNYESRRINISKAKLDAMDEETRTRKMANVAAMQADLLEEFKASVGMLQQLDVSNEKIWVAAKETSVPKALRAELTTLAPLED